MLRQIRGSPTYEAVDHMDAETLIDQEVYHMAADESGATSNDGKRTAVH